MALRVNAEEFVEKHNRRLKGALEDMRKGVDKVTESPTKKAADNIAKMEAKLMEAFRDGRVKRGLEGVSLDDWKEKMINKGIPRVAAGIDAAADKMRDFASWLLPKVEAAKNAADKIDVLTIDDAVRKAETYMRQMHKSKYK